MKKKLAIIVILAILALLVLGGVLMKLYIMKSSGVYTDPQGISYGVMTDSEAFYFYEKGEWQKKFIKGVNMSPAKPGAMPGDFAVTGEEYQRWFKYIADMNANTIRVSAIMDPEFYNALYEYNRFTRKPLYLLQGIPVSEADMAATGDAHDSGLREKLKKDIKSAVDIIHGSCYLPERKGYASGVYTRDISDYVTGWILGTDWSPDFVAGTDKLHAGMESYTGKYLYALNASPFEDFLCEMGDYAAAYETNTYKAQRPVSFANWGALDMLEHPGEPGDEAAVVNTEHIKAGKNFKPGLFASYDIYPYYPDFMSNQQEYKSFRDSSGKPDPYRAYLRSLKKQHTVPVLASGFGVPSSRGMSHINAVTGFNEGNIDEKAQGTMDASMLNDIFEEGFGGGIVSSWQDEWYRSVWNTASFDIADRRSLWSNPQSSGQSFGLLAFDTGADKAPCYVDGDTSDWSRAVPVSADKKLRLYVKSDEKYIYFLADTLSFDLKKDVLLIPIDTLPNQGSIMSREYEAGLKRPADFVIAIDGKDNSRVMVDAYYDAFSYIYSKQLKVLSPDPNSDIAGSGVFNREYLSLSGEPYLPQNKVKMPFSKYETGKLTYGDGNPVHESCNSLADFIVKDNMIEIRIPWQLLNVMDPSRRLVMEDLHTGTIHPVKIEGFYVGAIVMKDRIGYYGTEMKLYSWKTWDKPVWHERLKPAYYALKEAFGGLPE